MLTLTDNARHAVQDIATRACLPDDGGLRMIGDDGAQRPKAVPGRNIVGVDDRYPRVRTGVDGGGAGRAVPAALGVHDPQYGMRGFELLDHLADGGRHRAVEDCDQLDRRI